MPKDVVAISDLGCCTLSLITNGKVGCDEVELVAIAIDHSGRLVDVVAHIVVVALAGRLFYHRSKNQKAGIAVAPARSGLEGEFLFGGELHHVVHGAIESAV